MDGIFAAQARVERIGIGEHLRFQQAIETQWWLRIR